MPSVVFFQGGITRGRFMISVEIGEGVINEPFVKLSAPWAGKASTKRAAAENPINVA
jgi:hypothetical protein